MNLGVFQETKFIKVVYTRDSSGYRVAAMEAEIAHSGSVPVFYRAVENFSVKALHTYGENLFRFKLALGDRRWFIVGCYLAPDEA